MISIRFLFDLVFVGDCCVTLWHCTLYSVDLYTVEMYSVEGYTVHVYELVPPEETAPPSVLFDFDY